MTNYKTLAKTVGVLATGIVALALNTGCVSAYQGNYETDSSKPKVPERTEQYPTGYPGFSLRTMRFQNESPEIRNHENTMDRLRSNNQNGRYRQR
jgi:hypothetical protein